MKRSVLTVFVSVGVLCGCAGDDANHLDGSLTQTHSIRFDAVRARLYDSELAVEYVEGQGAQERISLRLTLRRVDEPIAAGFTYDLVERGSIARGAGYDAALPPLESGTLQMDAFGQGDGAAVEGSFDALFVMQDGSKTVLRGGFAASLEVVTF